MPPRYAYWTILIDNQPTAFRSRDKEELLPTLNQLRRKSSAVVMKWFARGRLWDTPEQAQWARTNLTGSEEKRRKDWRPGGKHVDPRARFDRRKDDRWKKPEGTAKIVRPAEKNTFRPAEKNTFGPAEKKTFGAGEKKTFRPAGSKDNRPERRWRGKKPREAENQRPWQQAGAAGGRPRRDGPSSGVARSGQQPPRNGPAAARPPRGPSRKDRG